MDPDPQKNYLVLDLDLELSIFSQNLVSVPKFKSFLWREKKCGIPFGAGSRFFIWVKLDPDINENSQAGRIQFRIFIEALYLNPDLYQGSGGFNTLYVPGA